jgi:hypothetical protein
VKYLIEMWVKYRVSIRTQEFYFETMLNHHLSKKFKGSFGFAVLKRTIFKSAVKRLVKSHFML